MAYHKNLNSLFKHLQNNIIPDILDNEVYETVVKAESANVKSTVYDVYDPFEYERRGTGGGLADPKNHIATFFYQGVGRVQMLVQNTTTGKGNNKYIAGIIEYGHGSRYGNYDYPYNRIGTQDSFLQPRPFISNTIKELQRTLAHVDAFKRGLVRHNIKTI